MTGPRAQWRRILSRLVIGPARAQGHATLAAAIMWTAAAVILLAGDGYRSVAGSLKGTDFIQFYTLAHVTDPAALYDPDALYALQVGLVPESAAERYLPVYPPHAAILFRPLAGFSYGTALLLWAATIAGGYAGCLWLAWRRFRDVLPEKRLVIAAGLAFAPFWSLVLHGQTTAVPLLAFCLGWLALEHGRRFWAGAALGFLLLKPQFAIVLAVVAVACREWRMMAGAAVSIAAQIAAVLMVFGWSPLWMYAQVVRHLPSLNHLLEPRPEQMHSLPVLTGQLPTPSGSVIWFVVAAFVVFRTIRIWRVPVSPAMHMSVLVLASVLVNPHLFTYDGTVLALPLLWLAGLLRHDATVAASTRQSFGGLVYWTCVALLAPTAAVIPLQLSVVLVVAIFLLATKVALEGREASLAMRTAVPKGQGGGPAPSAPPQGGRLAAT